MKHKPTILIVDDEVDSLTTFEYSFEDLFTVLKAQSAKEALQLVSTNPHIAVVITDQRMPEETGVQLLSKIKDSHPNITRVLLTGQSDLSAAIEAINKGTVYKYISKPYSPQETEKLLHEAVSLNDELMEQSKTSNRSIKLIQEKTAHAMESYTTWIAHHINNALQCVKLYVEYSIPKLEENSDKKEFAQMAKNYINKIAEIIRTLTDIYDKSLENFCNAPLSTLMQFESQDLSKLIEQKKILIKKENRNDGLTMMVNPMAIQEALRRLVRNAVEASSDGGVIEVSVAKFDDDGRDAVMFQVKDYGKGIEPEIKQKLFYPFLKLGSTAQEPKGLGLPFVQATVARHGGDIMVESKVGAGTTITFALPIIQQQAEPEDPLDKQARELLKRRK